MLQSIAHSQEITKTFILKDKKKKKVWTATKTLFYYYFFNEMRRDFLTWRLMSKKKKKVHPIANWNIWCILHVRVRIQKNLRAGLYRLFCIFKYCLESLVKSKPVSKLPNVNCVCSNSGTCRCWGKMIIFRFVYKQ